MSKTMRRGMLAGALAFAAAGVVAGFGTLLPTADAAPNGNPFAGSYSGSLPFAEAGFNYGWTIEISSRGSIRGATRFGSPTPYPPDYSSTARGTLRGVVSAEGTMSLSGEIRFEDQHGPPPPDGAWLTPAVGGVTVPFDFTATAVLDAAGNLVGTTAAGDTFTWMRK